MKPPSPRRFFVRTLLWGALLATVFTIWTPGLRFNLDSVLTPAAPDATAAAMPATTNQDIRIGVVSGHWGSDSGAVCDNGTTEAEVNLRIATLVQQKLAAQGYQVDLLQEFDSRLKGYKAAALVSIHNDSCQYMGDEATGFKIAAAISSYDSNLAKRLQSCMQSRYAQVTGLSYHPNTITRDMSEYHAFDEIDPNTPAIIIEAGFLNLDYNLLTQHPDLVAEGISAGILCYVRNENIGDTP